MQSFMKNMPVDIAGKKPIPPTKMVANHHNRGVFDHGPVDYFYFSKVPFHHPSGVHFKEGYIQWLMPGIYH